MKFSFAAVLIFPGMVSAFAPAQTVGVVSSSSISAAKTFEEDLEMTREVISKFMESQGEKPVEPPAPKKEEATKEE
ncbi:hypothetical protein IV203_005617 [Nitzschia inconspicua]|uniref:Uncharacterized protein n=1 Tax=Nitzschia inconspicua TaxID=303405 RepID=A0A9K3KMS0_9STRA|nr:hypothetical protein IV203_005617 [Nitzschia inconspicua]